jgi:hypothetical protein
MKSSLKHKSWLGMMIVFTSLTTAQGCSSSALIFRDPARLMREPNLLFGRPHVEKHVVRIVALWEASNGKGIDDKPSRGFAGQILFFGPKTLTGARVRGHVNIYQYDNFKRDSDDDIEPLHTFSFDPDVWDLHHTEGTLGHSYSCFIPYMRKHKGQATCGLKVEFVPENGQSVSSEITEVLLPSRSGSGSADNMTRGFVREAKLGGKLNVDQAGQLSASSERPATLDSVTIPLPKR